GGERSALAGAVGLRVLPSSTAAELLHRSRPRTAHPRNCSHRGGLFSFPPLCSLSIGSKKWRTPVISTNFTRRISQTKRSHSGGAMGRSAEVIAVKGLRKEYGTPRGTVVAVDEIDFKVAEGEFVAIVGPSGCGKSTLLKILAGLLPATRGEVKLRSS